MSGKRRKYTPEFREQAARLVIETDRVRLVHAADDAGILALCSMLMSAQSWNVCAARMPNCVWTVSF